MAYYATRDMRHPIYRTRRLKAGDEVTDIGPLAALFLQRKILTTEKPRAADKILSNEIVYNSAAEESKPKPTPRKRARRKK